MLAPALLRRRLARGEPVWTVGVELLGRKANGATVPVDAETGKETPKGQPRSYVLSTQTDLATDGHVLRQFWDLSRSNGTESPGIHAFFGHEYGHRDHVGEWENLGVQDLGEPYGRSLVGRVRFDDASAPAQEVIGKVDRGFLRSVSVGWIPGERVRRSSLKENDPLYRPAEEDDCGQPREGYVIGSEAGPNRLMEASYTFIPADPHAIAYSEEREAVDALTRLASGEAIPLRQVHLGTVLHVLRDAPGLDTYLARAIDQRLRRLGILPPDPDAPFDTGTP